MQAMYIHSEEESLDLSSIMIVIIFISDNNKHRQSDELKENKVDKSNYLNSAAIIQNIDLRSDAGDVHT